VTDPARRHGTRAYGFSAMTDPRTAAMVGRPHVAGRCSSISALGTLPPDRYAARTALRVLWAISSPEYAPTPD